MDKPTIKVLNTDGTSLFLTPTEYRAFLNERKKQASVIMAAFRAGNLEECTAAQDAMRRI